VFEKLGWLLDATTAGEVAVCDFTWELLGKYDPTVSVRVLGKRGSSNQVAHEPIETTEGPIPETVFVGLPLENTGYAIYLKPLEILESLVGCNPVSFVLPERGNVVNRRQSLSRRHSFTTSRTERQRHSYEAVLQRYIPMVVRESIKSALGTGTVMAEIREISVVFIEVVLPNKEDEHLECMHLILSTVQLILCCKHDGMLRQMMTDDKGCVIICAFGAPGTNSLLREQRAVLACWELLKAVEADNSLTVKLAIGVASGIAFCGNVGNISSRMEYCFVGDVVNMAARMMGISRKKQHFQVVCCTGTKNAACSLPSHEQYFDDIGYVEVKGVLGFPFFAVECVCHVNTFSFLVCLRVSYLSFCVRSPNLFYYQLQPLPCSCTIRKGSLSDVGGSLVNSCWFRASTYWG
jgi:hypothetical protein